MPYKNIQFVKVKMELLEDDRFLFDLNDTQKGLYILMLALAGKTNNKIRDEVDFIKVRLGLKVLNRNDLIKISQVFTKFKLVDNYWCFDNFDDSHNWILSKSWSSLGNSQGTPKDFQRKEKNRIDKNRIDNNIGRFAPPTLDQVIEYFTETLKATRDQAVTFFEFYGSKGWVVGKAPMKNWHLAASRSLKWATNGTQVKKHESKPFPTNA